MSIPAWVLLGFAMWTLLILAATVGVYRWSRILTGRDKLSDYGEIKLEGKPVYRRAMRAHANCVENLPVYGAIVVVLLATGVGGSTLDGLALVLMGARVLHSIVHIAFEQTNGVVLCRSMLFNTQWICMLAMGAIIASRVA